LLRSVLLVGLQGLVLVVGWWLIVWMILGLGGVDCCG